MIGSELVIQRTSRQSGFGNRFLASLPGARRAASLVSSLLDEVSAIPTGFPNSGQAMFTAGRPPCFGDEMPEVLVDLDGVMHSLLSFIG